MIKFKIVIAAITMAFSVNAFAHIWYIGWDAQTDGSLDLYGVSYHTGTVGGTGSVDDFSANPAGFVVNGTNVAFDGAVFNLEDCFGAGGIAGTCSSIWNSLGLDGGLAATGYGTQYYGKYTSVNLSASELSALGITSGTNSVLLSSYANNVDWQGLSFSSASVPVSIDVLPAPEPATLSILGIAIIAMTFLRQKSKANNHLVSGNSLLKYKLANI